VDTGRRRVLVPLHKLSQWLTYSLVEPLEESGLTISDLDRLTGLAEYRNGGLFVDLEVLVPRHPAVSAVVHSPESEVVVEWRALTVALLDSLAPLVAECLGLRRPSFRRSSCSKAGPGRRTCAGDGEARRRAADSSRDRRHRVLIQGGADRHGNCTVPSRRRSSTRPAQAQLMRMKSTGTSAFRNLLTEVSALLAYEVTRDLPTHQVTIDTPLARTSAPMLDGRRSC